MSKPNASAPQTQLHAVEVEYEPDFAGLLCPTCRENYLHHTGVTVYSRSEDGPVTITHVNSGSTLDNPSSRRDGVAIRFYCEMGCDDVELTIAQHKGQTLLAWRRA